MPTVRIRPIGSIPDVRKLAESARGAFDESLNTIGAGAKKDFDDIVAGWKHKPNFIMQRTRNTVAVTVKGPNAKVWGYVDQGVKPHIIRAKNKPLLKFRGGKYSAKTRAGNSKYRGPGTSSGGWVSKKQIRHPGSVARQFTRIIRNKWERQGRAVLRENLRKRRLPL